MPQANFDLLREELTEFFPITNEEDESGVSIGFTLTIPNALPVNITYFEEEDRLIFFCGAYGFDDNEPTTPIFQKALEFTLFEARTLGGNLGYEPDSHQLVYSRSLRLVGLTASAFRKILNQTMVLIAEFIESTQADSPKEGSSGSLNTPSQPLKSRFRV